MGSTLSKIGEIVSKMFSYGIKPFKLVYDIIAGVIGFILAPLIYVLNSFLIKLLPFVDEPHEKIVANFALIGLFTVVYKTIYFFQSSIKNKKSIYSPYSTNELSWYDALYFSFVVHFTLGFGDIFPSSGIARGAVIIHTTLFWFINLVDSDLVNKISGKVQSGFSFKRN